MFYGTKIIAVRLGRKFCSFCDLFSRRSSHPIKFVKALETGDYTMSRLFLTDRQDFFLNAGLSSRHILAASTFAGDSVFGSANMDITLRRIFSML